MTKPIPGAKIGRPSKQKPPERSRRTKGRQPLRLHPCRKAIACFDALIQIQGGARMAATTVVLLKNQRDSARKRTAPEFRKREELKEVRKAADLIRVTARRYNSPADMKWLTAIGDAIRNTIFAAAAGKEFWIGAETAIVGPAALVGEAAWARRILLPLTELEITKATPDPIDRAEQTPPPNKCDDDRGDALVQDFVNFFVAELKDRPNARLADLEAWSKDEIRKLATIIARMFPPAPPKK